MTWSTIFGQAPIALEIESVNSTFFEYHLSSHLPPPEESCPLQSKHPTITSALSQAELVCQHTIARTIFWHFFGLLCMKTFSLICNNNSASLYFSIEISIHVDQTLAKGYQYVNMRDCSLNIQKTVNQGHRTDQYYKLWTTICFLSYSAVYTQSTWKSVERMNLRKLQNKKEQMKI